MDVQTLNDVLLVGAGVLILAILGVRLSAGVGLPSLLAYLGIGVVLGYTAITFNDAELAQALAFAALAIILTEGGLTTSWSSVRSAMPLAVILATLGVGISTATIGAAVHLLLGLDWTTALILGAVVSSTDAAAVFSVLRRVPLRPRVAGALEAESGLNDPAAVLLVTLLSTGALNDYGAAGFLGILTYQMVAGAAIGLAIGYVAGRMLRRIALPSSGLYPLAVVTTAILAYAVATEAQASGFAAVYLGALLLGNSDLPHRSATRSFVEGLGWLAQIGLFVMLGLLVTPFQLEVREVVVAVVVGLVALLVARPVTVLVCALPFRVPWREQAFLSAAGMRGAVPVVLATIPLSIGYPGSKEVFALVFLLVVAFTLVQAPPLRWLAVRWGVAQTPASRDVELEAAPLVRLDADMLELHVTAHSRLHGVEVTELRLPAGASVALVVRDGSSFVPGPTTAIRHGDDLLVVAPHETRAETEARLRAISRRGRLAGWLTTREPAAEDDGSVVPLRWKLPPRLRLLRHRRPRPAPGPRA